MVLAIAVSNPEKIKTNNGAAGYIRSSLAVRNILLVKSSGHRTGITHSIIHVEHRVGAADLVGLVNYILVFSPKY